MSAALQLINNSVTNYKTATERAEKLVDKLCYECGLRKLPFMVSEMKEDLLNGFEDDLLSEIIDRTARAPRPSWNYYAYIRNKCARNDCHDLLSFTRMEANSMHARKRYDEILGYYD